MGTDKEVLSGSRMLIALLWELSSWFLRVQYLVRRRPRRRTGDWREAYHVLSQLDLSRSVRAESNSLVNNILLEIGKYDSCYKKVPCTRCAGYKFYTNTNTGTLSRCLTCIDCGQHHLETI